MKTIEIETRIALMAAWDRREGTQAEIAARYGVSVAMLKKLIQQRKRTGDIRARHEFSGPQWKLTQKQIARLCELAAKHPQMGLKALRDSVGASCSVQAIHYALRRSMFNVFGGSLRELQAERRHELIERHWETEGMRIYRQMKGVVIPEE